MVNKKQDQSGVSLIEVLVSAVLISMIFLWISDTHIASLTDIADTNNRNKAVWLAEEMIERIKINPLIDKYKDEISSTNDITSYCLSLVRCLNQECSEDEIIKYDIQQVFCNDLKMLNDMEISLECFDINTGQLLNPCYKKGMLRGRVTVSWRSNDATRGKLSAYSEVLFVINQSLYFDGINDYLTINGSLFSNEFLAADGGLASHDFTISMWVKPEDISRYQGFFGKDELDNIYPRSPSLYVTNQGRLRYDSYDSLLAVDRRLGNTNGFFTKLYVIDGGMTRSSSYNGPVDIDRFFGETNTFFKKNQWSHVAWIKKEEDYFFYKDGVLLLSRKGVPGTLHSKSNNWIGRVDGYFKGEINDLQIYGSALSEEQLLGVMEGHQFEDKNLLLYLDFEGDNFSESITDRSGSNKIISSHGNMNENNRRHAAH
ncbi:MAG: hypothetical protein PUP46_08315 [Endozoicomonas sp. (ex Botrylloides leachii)]|nr:hypothetical protein [Endozoicomonas sp. (ex Botrylloides leachii)]